MQNRYKEILNKLGYELLGNSNIKDTRNNAILEQVKLLANSRYFKDGKEFINLSNSGVSINLSPNLSINHRYLENLVGINLGSSYKISYIDSNKDNIKITINITKFLKGELIGKISFKAINEKDNKVIKDLDYGEVNIEQYPASALVKYGKGSTTYNDNLCTSAMFLNVIHDYLNGINEFYNNEKVKKAFAFISSFVVEDIDSIFELRDKNIDIYLESYNKKLQDLEKNYEFTKKDIQNKIKVLNQKK